MPKSEPAPTPKAQPAKTPSKPTVKPSSVKAKTGTTLPAQVPTQTAPAPGGQLPGPPAGMDFMRWLATQPQWVKDGWSAVAAKDANDKLVSTIKQTYGYLGAYLDDPEIGPVLMEAAKWGWDKDRLMGALSGTKWWQTTSQSARQWDALKETDPAQAQSQLTQRIADMRNQAGGLGLAMSDAQLSVIAEKSLRLGWDSQQTSNALGAEASGDQTLRSQLAMGTIGNSVRSMLNDYGIPMSDAGVAKWTQEIASGRATTEIMRGWLTQQAMSLHPGLSGQLQQGMTVRQSMDPYMQIAQNTLGISASQMALNDPKWLRALDAQNPDGTRVPMTLDSWQKLLKTDPTYGYQYTKQANDQAWSLVQQIGQMFGKVA